MSEGIDFSWARPGGAAIKAAGKTFVMRYVPYPGDGGKGLTSPEIADYRANGLDIGLVFESTASRHLAGYNAGLVDAKQCVTSLVDLGAPDTLPIYFAVDFDAQPRHFAAIDDYQRGAADVLGAERVGIYGSWAVVNHCNSTGTARWLWMTYAWSGGRLHPATHIYQYSNGEQLNGEVDFCRSFGDEQGLWKAQEEEMPDPRVDTLIADIAAFKRAVFAGSEQPGDEAARTSYADYKIGEGGQSVNDTAQSALVIALRGAGAITDGMDENEIRSVVSEELRKARIVLGG